MSTETITNQFTELMEHFEDEVPCVVEGHDHPAEWAFSQHHECGYADSGEVCGRSLQNWIERASGGRMYCIDCHEALPRTYAYTNAKWISL